MGPLISTTSGRDLHEAERIEITKRRRLRGEQTGGQEIGVEIVATGWRAVDHRAALESTCSLPAVVEARERAPVPKRAAIAPVLDVAQKIVNAAIGAEILGRSPCWLGKRRRLAGDYGDAVPRVDSGTAAQVIRLRKRHSVVPVVREEGDGIGDHRRRDVWTSECSAGPRVVIPLYVDGVFRDHTQTWSNDVAELSICQLERPAEEHRSIHLRDQRIDIR